LLYLLEARMAWQQEDRSESFIMQDRTGRLNTFDWRI
jgi:hypothetical protein